MPRLANNSPPTLVSLQISSFFFPSYYTGPQKKSGMNFTCEYTIPMDFEPLNPNPVSEFPLDPQFSPSPGEMREILEISVSVKAILIYAILNKTIIFSRISNRLVRISM